MISQAHFWFVCTLQYLLLRTTQTAQQLKLSQWTCPRFLYVQRGMKLICSPFNVFTFSWQTTQVQLLWEELQAAYLTRGA